MEQKERRCICKKCKSKRPGNYYEITPLGTEIWLCNKCTKVTIEEIKLNQIIK